MIGAGPIGLLVGLRVRGSSGGDVRLVEKDARDYALEDVGLSFEEATRPKSGAKVQVAVGG